MGSSTACHPTKARFHDEKAGQDEEYSDTHPTAGIAVLELEYVTGMAEQNQVRRHGAKAVEQRHDIRAEEEFPLRM
jgi:hypothetical protein